MPLLRELARYGQSIWLDNLDRGLIVGGKLKEFISDGITGITTNPTILEKAISGSVHYEKAIRDLVAGGEKDAERIYWALVFEDIGMAADLLRPCFEGSGGEDGFVSVEVPPRFAYDAEMTVFEGERIFREVGRPNLLIKVPATKQGLEAIKELIRRGVNVNATLVFSPKHYQGAAEAYLWGLERRLSEGKSLKVASVASFFVSRIDTAVDKFLGGSPLQGKTAISLARRIYQLFKRIFSSPRFLALKEVGALEQRIVWASTSTKNPLYSDVLYVEELIGPHTVNTLPETTLAAFKDHGRVCPSLEGDLEEAERVLEGVFRAGIDLDEICERLQSEGVEAFARSYDRLLDEIKRRIDGLV